MEPSKVAKMLVMNNDCAGKYIKELHNVTRFNWIYNNEVATVFKAMYGDEAEHKEDWYDWIREPSGKERTTWIASTEKCISALMASKEVKVLKADVLHLEVDLEMKRKRLMESMEQVTKKQRTR